MEMHHEQRPPKALLHSALLLSALHPLLALRRGWWAIWNNQGCRRDSTNKNWRRLQGHLMTSPCPRFSGSSTSRDIIFEGKLQLRPEFQLTMETVVTTDLDNLRYCCSTFMDWAMRFAVFSNVKFRNLSKETGSTPSIAFCLFSRSCKSRDENSTFFPKWHKYCTCNEEEWVVFSLRLPVADISSFPSISLGKKMIESSRWTKPRSWPLLLRLFCFVTNVNTLFFFREIRNASIAAASGKVGFLDERRRLHVMGNV